MSVLVRSIFFVSSYAPLLLLFALLESFGPGLPTLICAGVGAVSVVALIVTWLLLRGGLSNDQATFRGARNRDSEVMAYVVTYVVPFAAAADTQDQTTRWALALFAALIAVLYIRSAVFYVHPLLLLCGIHVFEAERNGIPCTVLTSQRYLRQECNLRVVRINQNVYLEARS